MPDDDEAIDLEGLPHGVHVGQAGGAGRVVGRPGLRRAAPAETRENEADVSAQGRRVGALVGGVPTSETTRQGTPSPSTS